VRPITALEKKIEVQVLVGVSTRRKYSECVRVRMSGVTKRPAK